MPRIQYIPGRPKLCSFSPRSSRAVPAVRLSDRRRRLAISVGFRPWLTVPEQFYRCRTTVACRAGCRWAVAERSAAAAAAGGGVDDEWRTMRWKTVRRSCATGGEGVRQGLVNYRPIVFPTSNNCRLQDQGTCITAILLVASNLPGVISLIKRQFSSAADRVNVN